MARDFVDSCDYLAHTCPEADAALDEQHQLLERYAAEARDDYSGSEDAQCAITRMEGMALDRLRGLHESNKKLRTEQRTAMDDMANEITEQRSRADALQRQLDDMTVELATARQDFKDSEQEVERL